MSSDSTILRLEGVGKTYDLALQQHDSFRHALADVVTAPFRKRSTSAKEFRALHDISFELERGDILGIIGDNGAGKSTLLKLLGQITEPTRGRITMYGKVASILEVGTGFHPELTGYENIYLSGSVFGMSDTEIDQLVEPIIEFSGIREFINTPVKKYSNGMFIRLAFSVIAHLEADIMLLDEVLSVGDAEFRMKSLKKIRALAAAGRTIVLVSHDLAPVQQICTLCLVLDKGRMEAMGPPVDLVSRYMQRTMSDIHEPGKISEGSVGPKLKRSWTLEQAHGNEIIQMLEVGVALKGEDPDQPIGLYCQYLNQTEEEILPTFSIMYNYSHPVMACNPMHQGPGNRPFTGKEPLMVSCEIPRRFFNQGYYSVSVSFLNESVKDVLTLENVVGFKITHDEDYLKELHYNGRYVGGLIPPLTWEFHNFQA